MKSSFRWNLFFHYCAIALTFAQGIVLVPLYLQYIPVEAYGYWLASGNLLAWLSMLDPGLSAVVQQRVANAFGASRQDELQKVISGAFTLGLLLAIVAGGVGYGVSQMSGPLLGIKEAGPLRDELVGALAVAALGTAFSLGSYSITAVGLGMQGAIGPGVIYVTAQVASILVAIALLVKGAGLAALGYATLVRGALLYVGAIGYLKWRLRQENLRLAFSLGAAKSIGSVTGYTFLAKLPSTVGSQLDVLFVARGLGPEIATAFGLTRRASEIARLLLERPTVAMMPAISHAWARGDHASLHSALGRLRNYSLWGALLAAFLSVALNGHFLGVWVGPGHYLGAATNVAFAFVLIAMVMVSTAANVGFALGDVQGNSIATMGMGLVNAGAIIVAALTGESVAVAAAPLVGLLTIGCIYFPRELARRLALPPQDSERIVRLLVTGVAMLVSGLLAAKMIQPSGWVSLALWLGSLLALGCAVLWSTDGAFREEVRRMVLVAKGRAAFARFST